MDVVICTVCARPPAEVYEISLHGEVTCVSHVVIDRCVFCSRPRGRNSTGWSPFTTDTTRCPRCIQETVETQEQARSHLPGVRRNLADIGIQLANRVRVELCDADSINVATDGAGLGMCLGRTHAEVRLDDRFVEVTNIEIARGLTAVHFGQTVAHEIGHAWLFQRGLVDLESSLAEGVCELFAGAWLKRSGEPTAPALRDALLNNPDPVYGGGYRMVRDAVLKFGITDVLHSVCTRGLLP